MPLKILASVRHFLRSFLRVLGMTSTPISQEFPLNTSVEDWESSLRTFYLCQDSEGLPQSKDMRSFKITKIRRYKEKRNLEHEYIIAEVSTTVPGELRYLKIERSAEDPIPAKAEKGTIYTLPKLSSQVSLAFSKKLHADDHVIAVRGWTGSDSCIGYLDCRNAPIILLDLAIAAKEVHAHSSMYQLFKRQCFWYSDMVVAILEHEFPSIRLVESSDIVERARAKDAIIDVFDEVSGTYKKLPIYSRRISIVKEIHDIYQIRKQEAYDSIKKAEAAAEQSALKLENADKRVEDANKRAEEAEEKARKALEEAEEKARKALEDADKKADKAQQDADKRAEEAEEKARKALEEAEGKARKALEDANKKAKEAQKEKEDLMRRIRELEATTQITGGGGSLA